MPVQPEFACATESTPTIIIMSSGQGETTIAVKAVCGDDIRRFHLPQGAGFESLVNEVVKRFSLEGKQIALKFEDDENQWCSLTTDEDLSEAQSIAKQLTPPILRVRIWVSVEVTGKQHARKDAPTCASAADEFAEAAQKFFFSFPEAAAEAHRMLQSFLAGAHSYGSLNDTEAPIEHSVAALSVGSVGSDTHSQVHQLADLDGHKHNTELYEEALNRTWKNDVGEAYESYFVNEAQTESLKESETPHTLSLHFLALVPHARSNVQVAGKMRARRTRNRRLPACRTTACRTSRTGSGTSVRAFFQRRATPKRIPRLRPSPPRPFPARPLTRRD